LVHLAQELPGVGREGLDVAPLALGVDGVEGERRLAGAREPGEHDEPVARKLEVDVAQIVLARASDPDRVGRVRHGHPWYPDRRPTERMFVRTVTGVRPAAVSPGS